MKRRPFKLKSGNNPSVAKFMGVSPVKDNGDDTDETNETSNETSNDTSADVSTEKPKELTPEELEKQKQQKKKNKLKKIGKIALSALEGGLNKAYDTNIDATSILDDKKDSEDKYKTLQEKYAELEKKLKVDNDDEK